MLQEEKNAEKQDKWGWNRIFWQVKEGANLGLPSAGQNHINSRRGWQNVMGISAAETQGCMQRKALKSNPRGADLMPQIVEI
jgi:hypothetical protein